MSKLNFSVFVDKVASGEKTQTIRPWNQPSIQKMKVGDRAALWWTKRGLKKGGYCKYCLTTVKYVLIDLPSGGRPFDEPFACPHEDRCGNPPLIILPRRLGVGTITEKIRIVMAMKLESTTVWTHQEPKELLAIAGALEHHGKLIQVNFGPRQIADLIRREGFEDSDSHLDGTPFVNFFKRYGISKKPMEFAVLRWRLEK